MHAFLFLKCKEKGGFFTIWAKAPHGRRHGTQSETRLLILLSPASRLPFPVCKETEIISLYSIHPPPQGNPRLPTIPFQPLPSSKTVPLESAWRLNFFLSLTTHSSMYRLKSGINSKVRVKVMYKTSLNTQDGDRRPPLGIPALHQSSKCSKKPLHLRVSTVRLCAYIRGGTGDLQPPDVMARSFAPLFSHGHPALACPTTPSVASSGHLLRIPMMTSRVLMSPVLAKRTKYTRLVQGAKAM